MVVELREVQDGRSDATLDTLGYRALTASDGKETMAILATNQAIDLLFSDVVMPHGLSGIEVAKEAKRLRSGIKVLLTSGYTPEILAQHGADETLRIFAKPYRQQELPAEIWRVLHSS
jgi:CheY-like chemotaxis protein